MNYLLRGDNFSKWSNISLLQSHGITTEEFLKMLTDVKVKDCSIKLRRGQGWSFDKQYKNQRPAGKRKP